MAAEPIVYCLDHLTDYTQFERLCHELMAMEGYPSIEPLGGCHDKGRDAIYVNRTDDVVTLFCYSVRDDWLAKLKQDAKVIHQHKHACDRLIYLSTYDLAVNRSDSAVADFLKDSMFITSYATQPYSQTAANNCQLLRTFAVIQGIAP